METNGWLKVLLEKMDDDISEIKNDVRILREFRWRVVGGVTVICVIVTVAIDLVNIWVRV